MLTVEKNMFRDKSKRPQQAKEDRHWLRVPHLRPQVQQGPEPRPSFETRSEINPWDLKKKLTGKEVTFWLLENCDKNISMHTNVNSETKQQINSNSCRYVVYEN